MQVRDLMSTDVVTVAADATLQTAAGHLLDNGVGSVVVLDDDGNPVGIVTESDLIRASYRSTRPFTDLDVAEVGHRPVITTEPTSSISLVAKKMAREDVKKVPVMDDLSLVGVVTLTDVVWHLSDIRSEAIELEEASEKWNPTGD